MINKILYILILTLIMVGFVFNEKNKSIFTKDDTLSLKGIFTIVIILHHISQSDNTYKILEIFIPYGRLAVSIFFFISAYGLMFQISKNKQNYIKSFIRKRFLNILIPVLITTCMYFIFNILFFGYSYTIPMIARLYINGGTIIKNGWYLNSILIIYLIFYFNYKLIKNEKLANYTFLFLTCLYAYKLINSDFGIWWYDSIYSFILGIIWYMNKDFINKIVQKNENLFIFIFSYIFIFIYTYKEKILEKILMHYEMKLYLFNNIISLSFCIAIILLTLKLNNKNKLINFLGKHSLEIYMIHGLIMRILDIFLTRNYIYIILVFIISTSLSYYVKKGFNKIAFK